MSEFHGVLPALITPFTEDGTDVDAEAHARPPGGLVVASARAWAYVVAHAFGQAVTRSAIARSTAPIAVGP